MGDSVSSGRWKFDYPNRRVWRDTSVTPTTVDQVLTLYSDIQDLFDISGQMDDPTPMSAQTPAEFTIGDPEGNDPDFPWFLAPEDAKYLYGGAIQTNSWTRTEGSVNGIVVVPYSGVTDPVASDIGKTIVHEVDSDSGVLLGFDTTRGELYIRPDSNAAANSFNSTSGNLDVTAGTQNVGAQTAAATTGEFLWANPYSLAPSLQPGTRIYAVQDGSKLTDWPASIGLNKDGQNDILIIVQVAGTLIDDGYVTFFARRGGTVYSHSDVDLSGGGRVPIPLSPQDNALNDGVGHHTLAFNNGGGTGTFAAGDVIWDSGDTETAAVVATTDDSGAATGNISYFLTRSLAQFSSLDSITNGSRTADVNGAPTNLDPVTDATTISPVSFTAISRDINNGAGSRLYSIEVDPNSLSFERVYRALQYMLRRGSTEQLDGVNGEQYRGSTVHLNYSGQSGGEFSEGSVVYGQTTGAFGTVVADHVSGTDGDLILRATRGTFLDTEQVGDAPSTPTVSADIDTVRSVPTLPSAPLGNIAGGIYFGAPGMFFVLANIASGSEQSYQLVDDLGVVQSPPNTVPVEVTSLGLNDWVSVFRLDNPLASGGQIVKNDYTSHATNNAAGDNTIDVQTGISSEAPPAGVVRVYWDTDSEDRYRYASWTSSTFTLVDNAETGEEWDGTRSASSASADGSQLIDSGAAFDGSGTGPAVEPGMIVRNTTDGSWGVVKSVDSATQLTLETDLHGNAKGLVGGAGNDWAISDAYQINKLRQTYDGSDTVYVPFLDQKNTAGSDESTTIIQSSTIPVVVKVRQGKVILPFTVGQTISSAGMSQAAIRTLDTIAT